MSEIIYDKVVFNGHIVTPTDILPPSVYIGIKDGVIASMSVTPLKGEEIVDCEGAYITPGGVDSHAHIDQDNAPTGDNFETGSRSAIAGGTTTMICFAIQQKNKYDLHEIVDDYHHRASIGSYCDYGFHLVLSDPSPESLTQLAEIKEKHGITSIKIYTTYPRYKLNDNQVLDILLESRKLGITTMIHAENSDVIDFINKKLEAKKLTDPFYHSISRPIAAEEEASYRVIALAKIIDVPILIVHMSAEQALNHVEQAQKNSLPIFAETCPQYLFLTSEYLKQGCCQHKHPEDSFESAKFVCSPPLRQDTKELEAVWSKINNGTITTFSSDHAPTKFDHKNGKKLGLVNGIPHFKQIPNGLPGLETRLPLLFCYGVETGRITPQKFVEVCCSNPARLYGLGHKKGSIAVGYDADLTIWYPKGKMTPFKLDNSMLHHDIDYSPYEGMEFKNWPKLTILRGETVWNREDGGLKGSKSFGNYLKRGSSILQGPVNPEINPIFA